MILDLDLGQEVAKNRLGLISVTSLDHVLTFPNSLKCKEQTNTNNKLVVLSSFHYQMWCLSCLVPHSH